jgi:hypothetical protein
MEAYQITIEDQEEKAEALYFPKIGRMGIAWGDHVTWAKVEDAASGIEMWLNNENEWNSRH